jgi:hypothetical protein
MAVPPAMSGAYGLEITEISDALERKAKPVPVNKLADLSGTSPSCDAILPDMMFA